MMKSSRVRTVVLSSLGLSSLLVTLGLSSPAHAATCSNTSTGMTMSALVLPSLGSDIITCNSTFPFVINPTGAPGHTAFMTTVDLEYLDWIKCSSGRHACSHDVLGGSQGTAKMDMVPVLPFIPSRASPAGYTYPAIQYTTTMFETDRTTPTDKKHWFATMAKEFTLFRHLVGISAPDLSYASLVFQDVSAIPFTMWDGRPHVAKYPTRPSERMQGSLGLAADEELVSAASAALTNRYGFPVVVSLRSNDTSHPKLQPNDKEKTDFPMLEGAFYGDFFSDPPVVYGCDGGNMGDAQRVGRECLLGDDRCVNVTYVGSCAEKCLESYNGDTLGLNPSFVPKVSSAGQSNHNGFTGCRDDKGRVWQHPITVFFSPKPRLWAIQPSNSLPGSWFKSTATPDQGLTCDSNQTLAGLKWRDDVVFEGAICKSMAPESVPDADPIDYPSHTIPSSAFNSSVPWDTQSARVHCAEDEYISQFSAASTNGNVNITSITCTRGNLFRRYCRDVHKDGGPIVDVAVYPPGYDDETYVNNRIACAANEYAAGMAFTTDAAGNSNIPYALLCCVP